MTTARTAALVLWVAGMALAQPPLTTIQDVLYKADGTRFNGIAIIAWTSFEAADTSNIATQSVTAKIVDGNLRVIGFDDRRESAEFLFGDVQRRRQSAIPGNVECAAEHDAAAGA